MGFYESLNAAVFSVQGFFSLPFPPSFPPPSVPSLLVIRNRCAGKWVACQDQVCFCPFKAKKPGGTFPKEREGWRQAEEEGGTFRSSKNERKEVCSQSSCSQECMLYMICISEGISICDKIALVSVVEPFFFFFNYEQNSSFVN